MCTKVLCYVIFFQDVIDVYVSHKFDSPRCVRLIDFNVFGVPTDGLMFDWEDLEKAPLNEVRSSCLHLCEI